MTSQTDLLAEYTVIGGYRVQLYANRLEITQNMLLSRVLIKNQTIPIRSIAKVEIPFARRMAITTIDGKTYVLNLHPWQAKDLRQRILKLV